MKHLHTFDSFLNESSDIEYGIKNIEDNSYIVRAMYNGKSVGELHFIKSRSKSVLMAGSLSVDPNHRRKGIASSMYEFAEKELGMKFVRSEDVLTPDGKLLWNNPNRKFGLKEESNKPAKYVVWNLNTRDNKTIDQCSVVFQDKLEYHSQLSSTMEQHHPKLFELKGGRYVRTTLALELGIMSPSDSYSLTCGLVKKIGEFLSFWEDEGYALVYNEPTDNEELFEEYIKRAGLSKFAKERL